MIPALLIAVIIYFLVTSGAKIRIPNAPLQATVDVLRAGSLTDEQVMAMSRKFITYADIQQRVAAVDDPQAVRLRKLTAPYKGINGAKLNFKVYKTAQINAFATADGSVRVFSGLMEVMTDHELMAIIGHELGHIRNSDAREAMRTAYIASATRNMLGSVGGAIGALSNSQLGGMAQKYAGAQFSQKQEFAADDFAFGFLVRNAYDPYAMFQALTKINRLAGGGGQKANQIAQLFATHPDSAQRAIRMRAKADAHCQKRVEG